MLGIFKGMGVTLKNVFRRSVTFQYPDEKRDDLADRFRGELKLKRMMGVDDVDRVETQKMPPCMAACPSNMKIREYVGLISEGKYSEAVQVMKEDNPLILVCGRVCPHPCEDNCRRGDKDESVAINNLKRFAADYDYKLYKEGKIKIEETEKTKSQKIAIVGAGPAGLTCAYFLAQMGYRTTIFDRLPVAGGMLRVGIPEYRLPYDILQGEVDQILALGVELKLNTTIDNLDDLFKDGFDAVFLGVGAHKPIKLGIEGEDLAGVVPGEGFLADVALRKDYKKGKNIAVIGGGNTAIDCARVSLREGADKVYILYRRSLQEMPAHEVEIDDALAEGIDIQYLVSPIKIIGKDGNVVSIECIRNELGEKDDRGRRRPVPVEGSEFVLEVDTIMSAISRVPEIEWLEPTDVEIHTSWGTIETDPVTGETSMPNVYAAGDVSLGADIAIAAIGGGKRAAITIDAVFSGVDIKEAHKRGMIPAMVKAEYLDEPRGKMPKLPGSKRKTNYDEVDLGLPQKQALIDAKRCLSCETYTCIGCNICAESCPSEAIKIVAGQDGDGERRKIESWDLDIGRCIFCGICVEACPTRTLHHTLKYELSELHVAEFIKDKEYLMRSPDLIEEEGWTKEHKHIPTAARLWDSGRPKVKDDVLAKEESDQDYSTDSSLRE